MSTTKEQVAFPTEGNAAGPVRASSGQKESPWWDPWKKGLQLASQLIFSAPFGLPVKMVQIAKYVSLAMGILDSVDGARKADAETKSALDAP